MTMEFVNKSCIMTNKTCLQTFITSQLFDPMISNEACLIFQWICFVVLAQIIAMFGILTNIINIICFTKQGFKDPVNISLLGLSVSDLLSLITVAWTNICYNPAFNDINLDFEPLDLQYLIGAWPHVTFTRVTSLITAVITLERCMCVTMPLKVKVIFTPKSVSAIIMIIFIVFIASVSPIYYVSSYGLKFSPLRNKTVLGLIFTDEREQVEQASFIINNVFISFLTFMVVIISTICLVVSLRRKAKWRKRSTCQGQAETLSNRDQKVARMIIMISTLFIVCFFPACCLIIAMLVEPQLSIDGRYLNVFIVMGGVGFLLESTNSAVNIFIYYYMSSRYKKVFREIIVCNKSNM